MQSAQFLLRKYSLSSRNIKIGEDNIYCVQTPNRSCLPVLLFVHGFGGFALYFAPLMNKLRKRFYCLAIDVPGTGFSNAKDPQLKTSLQMLELFYIDRIKMFIDSQIAHGAIRIVAHSYGGYIMSLFAYMHPTYVLKLYLLSPLSGQLLLPFNDRIKITLGYYLKLPLQEFYWTRVAKKQIYKTLKIENDISKWDKYLNAMSKRQWSSQPYFYTIFRDNGIAKFGISEFLNDLKQDITIVVFYGKQDWMPRQWIRNMKRKIDLHIFKNCTHQVQLDDNLYKYII